MRMRTLFRKLGLFAEVMSYKVHANVLVDSAVQLEALTTTKVRETYRKHIVDGEEDAEAFYKRLTENFDIELNDCER